MYFDPDPKDKAAWHEMYIQAVYDVVSGRYPCSIEHCKTLASMQLAIEFGDDVVPPSGKTTETLLPYFIPDKIIRAKETVAADLLSELVRGRSSYTGKSRVTLEREYLEICRSWKVYGSTFFLVEPHMNPSLPDYVFLAVAPSAVHIVNPNSKEIIVTHPYDALPSWGHNGASIILHVGTLVKQEKLIFNSDDGMFLYIYKYNILYIYKYSTHTFFFFFFSQAKKLMI